MMHREIRSKNLVSNSFSSAELVSIDGVTLDHNLSNIKYNAAENYSNYKENYFNTVSFGFDVKVPIFITPKEWEDYRKIENNKRKKLTSVMKLEKLLMKCRIIILPTIFERTVEKRIV